MRKGLEQNDYVHRPAVATGKTWWVDFLFPAVLVGAAYLAAGFIGVL